MRDGLGPAGILPKNIILLSIVSSSARINSSNARSVSTAIRLPFCFINVVKVLTCFRASTLIQKLFLQLLPWGASQPVRTCDSVRGDVVPRDEQGSRPVRLIRESSKMLVAPFPFDADRNLFVLLLSSKS